MKIKLDNNNIITFIFIFAYFFFLIYSFFGHIIIFHQYLQIFVMCSILCLVMLILVQFKSYTNNEVVVLIVLLIISILCFFESKDSSLIKLTLFIYASKMVDLKKCFKYDLILRIILFSILICLSYFSVAEDVISYYENNMRHSLGFTNPNALAMQSLIISFECILVYFNDKGLIIVILVLLFNVLINIYSGSRTSIFIIMIGLILILLYKYIPNIYKTKLVKSIIIHSFIIFMIITFVLVFLFNSGNNTIVKFDYILSYRLTNISYYLQMLPLKLFGQDLSFFNRTLDSCYAFITIGMGIIPTLVYGLFFYKMFKFIYKKREYLLLIIMFCFIIYGLSERLWLSIDYNFFVILLSVAIFKKDIYSNY